MPKEAKLERMNTDISALGLDKCKNTVIGTLLLYTPKQCKYMNHNIKNVSHLQKTAP